MILDKKLIKDARDWEKNTIADFIYMYICLDFEHCYFTWASV
mgnify:CR=1 FL=1